MLIIVMRLLIYIFFNYILILEYYLMVKNKLDRTTLDLSKAQCLSVTCPNLEYILLNLQIIKLNSASLFFVFFKPSIICLFD